MPQTKKNNKRTSRRSKRVALLPLVTTTPSTQRVIQTFSAAKVITESAVGLGASYFYRLNSVYDPDSSGVGLTAGAYSNFAAMFLNYKVRRVTVRIQGTSTCSSGSFNQAIIAPVASQAVIPTDPVYWRTVPMSTMHTLAPNANGGVTTFSHVKSYDLATVSRLTKQQFNNDMDFSGTIGSNPARQIYLFVGVQSVGSSSVATLTYTIQITYEVEWFNPVPLQA